MLIFFDEQPQKETASCPDDPKEGNAFGEGAEGSFDNIENLHDAPADRQDGEATEAQDDGHTKIEGQVEADAFFDIFKILCITDAF